MNKNYGKALTSFDKLGKFRRCIVKIVECGVEAVRGRANDQTNVALDSVTLKWLNRIRVLMHLWIVKANAFIWWTIWERHIINNNIVTSTHMKMHDLNKPDIEPRNSYYLLKITLSMIKDTVTYDVLKLM